MKNCGIYEIRNLINNKVYVGQSVAIRQRLSRHKSVLRHNKHDNNHLQNAWNKYGESNFKCTILEYVENENDLDSREQYYINKFNSFDEDYGYNKTEVSESGRGRGWNHKQETRLKIGMNNKGKNLGENCGKSILTEDDVIFIKECLRDNKLTQSELAKMFNIDKSAISNIKTGDTWNHIKVDGFVENNKGRTLSKEQVIKIKTLLIEGTLSQSKIAEQCSVSQIVVSRINREEIYKDISVDGFKTKEYFLTNEQIADIESKLNDGVSAYRIAKDYGCSFATIYKIKNKQDIKGEVVLC